MEGHIYLVIANDRAMLDATEFLIFQPKVKSMHLSVHLTAYLLDTFIFYLNPKRLWGVTLEALKFF